MNKDAISNIVRTLFTNNGDIVSGVSALILLAWCASVLFSEEFNVYRSSILSVVCITTALSIGRRELTKNTARAKTVLMFFYIFPIICVISVYIFHFKV